MNFLDYSGLQRFLDRLKAIIPTKTSDITNDSGYLDTTGVQNYMENGGGYSQSYIDTALSGKAAASHTHSKTDLTDLFSSANTWTGTNKFRSEFYSQNTDYTIGTVPQTRQVQSRAFTESNNATLGNVLNAVYETSGVTVTSISARNKTDGTTLSTSGTSAESVLNVGLDADGTAWTAWNGTIKSAVIPYAADSYNLGSANNQWNWTYTKNLVLNGTLFGLDRSNVWGQPQEMAPGGIRFRNDNYVSGTPAEDVFWEALRWGGYVSSTFTPSHQINTAIRSNGYSDMSLRVFSQSNEILRGVLIETNADASVSSFRALFNETTDLGTSTYKWNNTYTKKLYLNGTEFGLDTANTWTAQNSFNSDLNLNYASTDVDDIVNSVAGSATLDNFVHLTGNETVNGIKSFPNGIVANVTGSATSATNDGSGNAISTTYGKLGAVNVWTADQICTSSFYIQHPSMETSVIPSNTKLATYYFSDKNGAGIGGIRRYFYDTGDQRMQIFGATKIKDGQLDPTGSVVWFGFSETCKPNGDRHFSFDGYMASSLNPYYSNQVIGTSSNMWSGIWVANTDTKYLGLNTTLKTKGVAPSGSGRNNTSIAFRDPDYNLLGKIEHNCYSSGDSFLEFSVENNYTNGALDPNGSSVANSLLLYLGKTGDRSFFPSYNNEVYLGASNRQWKSVFAQTYYYNGTQWGLDQANVWSCENWHTASNLNLKDTVLQRGVLPTSNRTKRFRFADKNNSEMGWIQYRVGTNGDSYTELYSSNSFDNGQLSDQGTNINNKFVLGLHSTGQKYATIESDFYPAYTNLQLNLGTSVNKWKSFNGLNPGRLSFPDMTSADVDIIDTQNWNVSGGYSANDGNFYTPLVDGWLHINIKDTATNSVFVYSANSYAVSAYGNGSQNQDGRVAVMMPVLAGVTYGIIIKAGSTSEIYSAKFIPCKGNV